MKEIPVEGLDDWGVELVLKIGRWG